MGRSSRICFALAAVCCFLLGLTGCGGSSQPKPTGDYTLSVTPASLTVQAGSTGQFSVKANATNGFSQSVSVAISGLPTGVTASPSTLSLTPGTPQTITLTAASSAPTVAGNLALTGTSGTLSHSATVALTVSAAPAPPADFSLAATPASQTLSAGGSGAQVTLTVTPTNGFSSPVAIAVSGLPAGVSASPATLNITPGTPTSLTLTAAASAPAGSEAVTFTGSSGAVTHTATLSLTVMAAPAPEPSTGPDVTTYHYDNTRQGWNPRETILTPANVNANSFGLLGNYTLDGKVDAAPLYLNAVSIPGKSTHNVIYAATENDSVYALDAATGAQLWKSSVLGESETPSDNRGCDQITPTIGVTSTPVIDRGYGPNGAIFVVGMSKDESGKYHQRLHALDVATGAELPGSPTEITATYPGSGANSSNGQVVFDPGQYAERAALLLLNGNIYTSWTSHCDIQPYTGWVIGYSEKTLKQSTVLNLTPNGSEGSIWMSGYGLAADSDGNIYFLDANGTFDGSFTAQGFPSQNDYGNAILKLSTQNGLAVSDFFEPYNTVSESGADIDLGSGGGMLLPDLLDSAGNTRRLIVGAGKDKNIYVADRDNLGKFNQNAANNSNIYQEITNALPNGAWSGPAYYNNTVYYGGVGDVLKAYAISNAKLSTAPTSQSATALPYPGTTPSVSSNGTTGAIVWALASATGKPAVLHAYDATNLGKELYNSNQAPSGRDAFGNGNKFLTPVVANGKVMVGTPTGVAVFGLLGAQ